MQKISAKDNINRIIDANINRLKEGLRVLEEIARFHLSNYKFTSELKNLRHRIDTLLKNLPATIKLIKQRDASRDIGKNIYANELKRKDVRDIFFANMQRAKESVRVLEEFSKLININIAVGFKKIRYRIYELEKKIAQKISSLHRFR